MNVVIVLSSLALIAQVISTWTTFGIRDLMSRKIWTPLFMLNVLLCFWCGSSIYAVFSSDPLNHHLHMSLLGVCITLMLLLVIRRLHRQLEVQRQKILELAIATDKELAVAHTDTDSLALKLAHYFIERKGVINGGET